MSGQIVAYCMACGQPLDNPLAESHLTPECLETWCKLKALRAADTGRADAAKYWALADGIASGRLAEAAYLAEQDADSILADLEIDE